jgi:hypothetical protein
MAVAPARGRDEAIPGTEPELETALKSWLESQIARIELEISLAEKGASSLAASAA